MRCALHLVVFVALFHNFIPQGMFSSDPKTREKHFKIYMYPTLIKIILTKYRKNLIDVIYPIGPWLNYDLVPKAGVSKSINYILFLFSKSVIFYYTGILSETGIGWPLPEYDFAFNTGNFL